MNPNLLRALGLILLMGSAFFLGRRTAPQILTKSDGRTQLIDGKTNGLQGSTGSAGAGKGLTPGSKTWLPLTGSADDLLKRLLEAGGTSEFQYLLVRAVDEAPPDLLRRWAAELAAIPATRPWQPEALQAVAKRWAGIDAPSALNWAQGLPPTQGKSALAAVLGGIAEQDPARAISMAKGLPSGAASSAALIVVAGVLRRTDPTGALALISGLKWSDSIRTVIETLEGWAQTDPGSAAAAAAAMNKGSFNYMDLVYRKWALQDPQAALASAGTLPKSSKRYSAISAALTCWAQRDPAAALAYCKELRGDDQYHSIGTIMKELTKTDPGRALAALQDLPAKARLSSVGSLASSWVETDMEGALSWAKNLTNAKERSAALEGLGEGLIGLDPARQQAIIESMPEGKSRNDFLNRFISRSAYQDPVCAAKMLEFMEPHARQKALSESSLLGQLDGDPELQFRLASSIPSGKYDFKIVESLKAIASINPAKAENLLLGLEPDRQKNILPGFYGDLAGTNGPGALAKARAVADESTRKNVVDAVFNGWAASDADALLAWAKTAEPGEKNQAMPSAIFYKASEDPGAAAKLADAFLQSATKETQATAGGMISSVSNGLFQENPQEAARWVAGLPAGDLLDKGISAVASNWVNSDPVEASVWIRSLPAGSPKDRAVGQLIEGIRESDPTSALAWAGSIGEEGRRNSQMNNVFQSWVENDKTVALEALKTAPMSDAAKETIRQNAAQK